MFMERVQPIVEEREHRGETRVQPLRGGGHAQGPPASRTLGARKTRVFRAALSAAPQQGTSMGNGNG